MKEYHKIKTVFKRNPKTNYKTLLEGQWAKPEFEYLKDNTWVFTEKVNGFNIRVIFDGSSIVIAGRTNRDQLPPATIASLNDIFQPRLELFKEMFADGICLYGEAYGPNTAKGSGVYRQDQDFVLFDVLIGKWWLERSNVISVALKLDVLYVPAMAYGTLPKMIELARTGFNSAWGDFQAEGIVARPTVGLQDRAGNRIITKIKCKDFP